MHHLAARGALIATLLAPFGLNAQHHSPEIAPPGPEAPRAIVNSPGPQDAGQGSQGHDQSQPQQAAPQLGSVKKPGEAEEPRSEGSEKSTRDENDATKRREAANLAAAESMADSAIKMLSLTFAQIVVGILGIIGLGATIHYSRKTAQAAIAATNLAKETTAIQLRAYITLARIDTVRIEIVENLPGISFVPVWKNSGATPARNVQYYTVCDYSRNAHPQKRNFPILNVSQNRTIIGPGIDELGPATEDIPDPLLLALARCNHSIFIYGAIDYTRCPMP